MIEFAEVHKPSRLRRSDVDFVAHTLQDDRLSGASSFRNLASGGLDLAQVGVAAFGKWRRNANENGVRLVEPVQVGRGIQFFVLNAAGDPFTFGQQISFFP